MKILFRSRDPKAESLREWASERVAFVFRRHPWAAPRATVQLSDLNGPRGGMDKQCVIEVSAAGASPVIIRSVADNWHAALNRALSRASVTLKRMLRRTRDANARALRTRAQTRPDAALAPLAE